MITICMGSSCFSRGNNKNLGIIKEFLEKQGLDIELEICGSHCNEMCSRGPLLIIDGVTYENVKSATLIDILKKHFTEEKNGTTQPDLHRNG